MKTINGTKFLDIPEGVEVTCKSRTVSVKGPRGELTRTFKHVQLEMEMTTNAAGAPQLKIQLWFGTRKQIATIRTKAESLLLLRSAFSSAAFVR